MTYHHLSQTKKPKIQALIIITILCLFWSFKPSLSLANESFVSPIPSYRVPQVKGESTNDNSNTSALANMGYPLIFLGVGSGIVSGLIIYKRSRQKDLEEIRFVEPQTS